MLDKAEIWAQKYPHAHPMWFGSFSAFLVVTDPDYAKVLLSRGGERSWLQRGAATPACRFPMSASKFTARQGFRNHLKTWRDTPPSCCALGTSGTGVQG